LRGNVAPAGKGYFITRSGGNCGNHAEVLSNGSIIKQVVFAAFWRVGIAWMALTVASFSLVSAADDLKPFPPPGPGMTRHVIRLPKQEKEGDLKLELMVGKTVRTVNRHFFGGELKTETIPGWGFDRYILSQLGPMGGTLMAVPPDAPTVEQFVTLGGETIIRYNSRVPVVVYVPAGVEVRYRFWRAETPVRTAPAEQP
jgi:ecotin